MNPIKWTILGNVLYGLLQVAMGLPLLLRKVPRNASYGYRTKAALESDQAWYDLNSYHGRCIVMWSGLVFSNALTGFFVPVEGSDAYLAVSLALAAVAIMVPVLMAVRYERNHRVSSK